MRSAKGGGYRGRDYQRRRHYSPKSRSRSGLGQRGINDRWKHDKFEEEEEKRVKGDRWGKSHPDHADVASMDDAEEHQGSYSPGRRKKYQPPTTIIYVKGLPADVTEAEVYDMIESLNDSFTIQAIRLGKDRLTGAARGFGFIEFPTIEDSRKFMESPAAADLQIRHHPLWTNYSSAPTPGHRHEGVHMDWMCNMCQAINFARRLECYQCCAPRGKDVQRISNEPMGPSNILKVSGLDPHTSENDLHTLFSSLVAVKEIRMVMDKFTSAPRGFAFVHFFTVADACRAMNTFQGWMTEIQRTPIKLFYAKDRVPPMTTGATAAAAIEAAQAMQQYNALWEPKEFDESAAEINEPVQDPVQDPSTGIVAHDVGGGFVYDPNSGYYYHEATGYYYDGSTGMYYNSATKEWLMYDQNKNEYVPYVVEHVTTEQGPTTIEALTVEKTKPIKRPTCAVIGAKPMLNPENMAAYAKTEQDKTSTAPVDSSKKKAKTMTGTTNQELPRQQSSSNKTGMDVGQPVNRPRVKGVIRGGKWSGGLMQSDDT